MDCFITDFVSIDLPFSQSQDKTLTWVAKMHQGAETRAKNLSSSESDKFYEKLSSFMQKLGLGPEKIQTRHLFFDDFFKSSDEKKQIYDFDYGLQGADLSIRTKFYDKVTSECLESLYKNQKAPKHLIHTTCTGYISPSCAQKLVSKKGWGDQTTLTHAYHMGCYASIPSVRIAAGVVFKEGSSCDIVHTEFCSLHMDPLNHSIGQLVIESLFADGAIKYHLKPKLNEDESGFKICCLKEKLIPDSLNGMSWETSHFGFAMTLSKDVPTLIGSYIQDFVSQIKREANIPQDATIVYAIHPGGPKIIDSVAKVLELEPSLYAHSRAILKQHGNMSSATLPHIWQMILDDPEVRKLTYVISLAFGPGLTMAGAVFQKVGNFL